ncbi:hypothetical protein HRbin11_01313 [bacterium HR11]|nr:hypothetical protein HRbin11_01313 [bacterium HR11]
MKRSVWRRFVEVLWVVARWPGQVLLFLYFLGVLALPALWIRLRQDPLRTRRRAVPTYWDFRKRFPATLEEARRQF